MYATPPRTRPDVRRSGHPDPPSTSARPGELGRPAPVRTRRRGRADQSTRSSGVARNASASGGTYGISTWIATAARQAASRKAFRPRRWIGSRTLRFQYARTHWPTTSAVYASQAACANDAAVGQHDDQGGDRGEPAGQGDPAQDPVREQRLLGVARRARHELGLGWLPLERDRRREVDEQLHPQDLERAGGPGVRR